jgi:hypothetical protein
MIINNCRSNLYIDSFDSGDNVSMETVKKNRMLYYQKKTVVLYYSYFFLLKTFETNRQIKLVSKRSKLLN